MIYDLFTLGSSANYITFNDDSNPAYYIRATRRFVSSREIRQYDAVVPDEMGVVDYQTLIGKSHIIIEGKLYPISGDDGLYEGMEKVRSVCNPKISQDDNYSDDGYILLTWTDSAAKQLRVKPLYVDIPESIKGSNTPKIKIVCKVRYPFIESQTLHSSSVIPDITAGTGTPIPATGLPIASGGVGFGADSGTGAGALTNAGDYRAYPTINITAPINSPRLTNTTTGKYIQFNYNLSSGTANVNIDYDGVTAEASDGTNLLQHLAEGSDLENFYLQSGANVITLTASGVATGTDIDISWRDSWPL